MLKHRKICSVSFIRKEMENVYGTTKYLNGQINLEKKRVKLEASCFLIKLLNLLLSHSVMSNSLRPQSCPTLWDPMDCSTPGFPVLHCLLELAKTQVHWIGNAIKPLILRGPLLLLPSIFPSIRVFSNESALLIRWPKYWNFSLSISPSNEYSGLISFRMDWFDLLAV